MLPALGLDVGVRDEVGRKGKEREGDRWEKGEKRSFIPLLILSYAFLERKDWSLFVLRKLDNVPS